MHTEEPRKNPLVDLGYETEDLNMRAIGKGAKFFFGFVFACIFGGFGLFYWMNNEGIKNAAAMQSPMMDQAHLPAPPNPLLQTNVTVRLDTQKLRQKEMNALANPAYIDQGKGIVRIPIDRAIDLTVEKLANPAAPSGEVTPDSTVPRERTSPTTPSATPPPANTTPANAPTDTTVQPSATPSSRPTDRQGTPLTTRPISRPNPPVGGQPKQ